MKALLIVAHGSRNNAFNDDIDALAKEIAGRNHGYGIVSHAFLELVQPDIPAGIHELVENGATSITVLPYFLARGSHVTQDIPELVEEARTRYPQLTLSVLTHIGGSGAIADFVERHLDKAD